jgi:hypothetical protein
MVETLGHLSLPLRITLLRISAATNPLRSTAPNYGFHHAQFHGTVLTGFLFRSLITKMADLDDDLPFRFEVWDDADRHIEAVI